MDIGSIFLILGLLIFVALFVGRPLFERTAVSVSRKEQAYSMLLAERDRILGALQELDFDFALGKIPEGLYPDQRARLLNRGADVLRQLDSYQAEPATEQAEERLEAAIAARAVARTPVTSGAALPYNGRKVIPPGSDDELEALISARRRLRQEKAGGFCHKCGSPLQKSDRFCPKCGAELA